MATLLSVVQKFCRRRGMPYPTGVYGSGDDTFLRLMGILEEGCEALADRYPWQGLRRQASWTSTATESQGALSTLAPDGFKMIINDTFWDRTQTLPVKGPLSPQKWQAQKAIGISGGFYYYRIFEDALNMLPTPAAGHTLAFEYWSTRWGRETGGSYVDAFTADDNTILLPESMVLADLTWRWKKDIGLEFAQDFMNAEALIVNAIGRDGGKPVLDMSQSGDGSPTPAIILPMFGPIS